MTSIAAPMPTDVSIITTYRCQMRCKMCDIWEHPTDKSREITARDLEMLPKLRTVNITGGEPFVRKDLDDIIEVMMNRAPEIVISTSGWHTERILALAEKFPTIGIRVSIEGLSEKNDYLRGRVGGFDRALKTLLGLRERGIKNIGFGITVSNSNSGDLIPLYRLSKELGFEFSTATFHNSFYFHKDDNEVTNKDEVIRNFQELIHLLLKENHPKAWFRALFNLGLINYIRGGRRMLPCEAGSVNFFVDPYGEVYPCNGMEDKYWKESMGNIRETKNFQELWFSEQAQAVREQVRRCPKNCWMIGTAAPVFKKYLRHSAYWALKNKAKSLLGKPICIDNVPYWDVGQDPSQGNLDPARLREEARSQVKIAVIKFVGDYPEDTTLVDAMPNP